MEQNISSRSVRKPGALLPFAPYKLAKGLSTQPSPFHTLSCTNLLSQMFAKLGVRLRHPPVLSKKSVLSEDFTNLIRPVQKSLHRPPVLSSLILSAKNYYWFWHGVAVRMGVMSFGKQQLPTRGRFIHSIKHKKNSILNLSAWASNGV